MRYSFIFGLLAASAMASPACNVNKRHSCDTPSGSGKCMSTSSCKGFSVAGFCPGGASNQCCVTEKKCTTSKGSGTCMHTSNGCSKGSFVAGACPGDNSVQCCVEGGSGGSSSKSHKSTTHQATGTTSAAATKTSPAKAAKSSTKAHSTTQKEAHSTTAKKPAASTQAAAKPKDGNGKLSEEGLKLIESEEGWRSTWYTINGDKTIGYGHDCTQKGDCSKIKSPLSRAEGEALMKKDVAGFEKCVCDLPNASKLNTYQFGALVSFAYNSGCGGVSNYFRSYMSKKDFSGICSDLPSTNTLGGELTSRRKREAAFCKKDTKTMSGC